MKDVENKKQNKFFAAVWNWIKENRFFLLFILFATIIEMTTVFVLEGTIFMSRPFLSIGLMILLSGLVLLVPSRRLQVIIFSVLLLVLFVFQLVFTVIFDLTEQYFEYEMLSLKNDAFGTLENIPIRFALFYVGFSLSVAYIILGLRGTRNYPKLKKKKGPIIFKSCAAVTGLAMILTSFYVYYPRNVSRYEEMINGRSESSYAAYGVTGNLVGEFVGAMIPDTSKMTNQQIADFIYAPNTVSEESEYFGVSKGNNVVTILAETLEWYSFILNPEKYPNALPLTETEMEYLYPNLRAFMRESVQMTNFHSREKTDISETLSLMGSYPTTGYLNYDYYENEMPLTIANVLQTVAAEDDVQCRSFHNGFKTFYNRHYEHKAFGFESLTDMYDMAKKAKRDYEDGKTSEIVFQNYMKKGERNLDSEMIEVSKNEMFPTNRRFYTYITTITMHGVYYDRDNLSRWNEKLGAVLGDPNNYRMPNPDDDNLKDDLLYYYMVTALEFDEALGKVKKELASRPNELTEDPNDTLLDNTTIVVFGDHNAYYHSLSKYVKDIDDYETDRLYTNLYNVPLMIYDKKLTAKIAENGGEDMIVEKFTCTADIASTILDLLGIRYYTNMYYGTSVFHDEASVLYSRAYDTFISSGIVGRSVNSLLYRSPNVTAAQFKAYQDTAIKLVDKIKYCDYMHKQDYFGSKANMRLYREKITYINSAAYQD